MDTEVTVFTQLWKSYQACKLEISEQFDILAQREDNWDGHGSPKPTDLTLSNNFLKLNGPGLDAFST